MSQTRKDPFIHPFNFFIVDYGIEDTHKAIRASAYNDALNNLFWFIRWLDPDIRKDLHDEILLMENMRNGKEAVTEPKVVHIIESISQKLHDKGYFLAAKFTATPRIEGQGKLTHVNERETATSP